MITLSNTRVLLFVVSLGAVVGVAWLLAPSSNRNDAWCRHIDIPRYERQFGFTLGGVERSGRETEHHRVAGVASVTPGGAFAMAGLRPGDVPRMHHGLHDLCSTLRAAARGEPVTLSVANLESPSDRRTVTLNATGQHTSTADPEREPIGSSEGALQ